MRIKIPEYYRKFVFWKDTQNSKSDKKIHAPDSPDWKT